MDSKGDLNRFIETFRFQVISGDGSQISSTWAIKQNKKEDSVFIYVRNFGGKLKLTFHPVGGASDGDNNDSQYGLVHEHREFLKRKGILVPGRIRWKRPNDKEKINLGVRIIFPTNFLTGDVYQFIKEKKPKVSLEAAPPGYATEVNIFFHYLDPKRVEEILVSKGYVPFYYMMQKSGEIVQVAFKINQFDDSLVPKIRETLNLSSFKRKITSLKNIHATLINDVKDFEPIILTEINGSRMMSTVFPIE